jgi:hypothetical protein
MAVVIRFNTRLFDLGAEPVNPINPIPGVSALEWLATRVPAEFDMSDPDAEDWGWYSHASCAGRTYLIGASANPEPDGNHEFVLQIDKSRSFKEKILGRGKMDAADPCVELIHKLLTSQPEFTDVDFERDA